MSTFNLLGQGQRRVNHRADGAAAPDPQVRKAEQDKQNFTKFSISDFSSIVRLLVYPKGRIMHQNTHFETQKIRCGVSSIRVAVYFRPSDAYIPIFCTIINSVKPCT